MIFNTFFYLVGVAVGISAFFAGAISVVVSAVDKAIKDKA